MATTVALTSCTNDDVLDSITNNQTEETAILTFKYQGVEYEAEYVMQGDEKIFKNEQIGEMLQVLKNNPNGATLTYPNGMVEYFDSTKDLEEYIKNCTVPTTKATYTVTGINSCSVTVYEDSNYGGDSYSWTNNQRIANLETIDDPIIMPTGKHFYKNISSFKFKGTVRTYTFTDNPWGQPSDGMTPPTTVHAKAFLTFYEEKEYKGRAQSYVIDTKSPELSISNLGDFNDKASSLIISLN